MRPYPAVRAPAVMVAVNSLRMAYSLRLNGESGEHVQVLAGSLGCLPPILVHRPSLQIIDGMHRLRAAVQDYRRSTVSAVVPLAGPRGGAPAGSSSPAVVAATESQAGCYGFAGHWSWRVREGHC